MVGALGQPLAWGGTGAAFVMLPSLTGLTQVQWWGRKTGGLQERPFFLLFLPNRKGWLEAGSVPTWLPTTLATIFCLLRGLSPALNLEGASTTQRAVSFAGTSLQH